MRCIFTNRIIAMMCFSISTNRTIGTNGPLELPCNQLDHMEKSMCTLRAQRLGKVTGNFQL